MRVCTFAEFAAMPDGTIFSYWEPAVARGLYRKGETINRPAQDGGGPFDYWEQELLPTSYSGGPPEFEDALGRWGTYDFDQLYAVYELRDLEQLKAAVNNAIELAEKEIDERARRKPC